MGFSLDCIFKERVVSFLFILIQFKFYEHILTSITSALFYYNIFFSNTDTGMNFKLYKDILHSISKCYHQCITNTSVFLSQEAL